MAYHYRRGKKRSGKETIVWLMAFIATFFVGGITSIVVVMKINRVHGLAGVVQNTAKGTSDSSRKLDAPYVLPSSAPSNAATTAGAQVTGTGMGSDASVDLSLRPCVQLPTHAGLAASSVPQLKKLAEYEKLCGGSFARASFFAEIPSSASTAITQADWVAGVLKEFARFGIKPIIFFEPASGGSILDLNKLAAGDYDGALSSYYSTLKSKGVNDTMMGTWVPVPEGNIPVWNNTNPADFAGAVTKVVQAQKNVFPASKAAILLESKSYPSGGSWSGGAYKSLLPYVQPIPRGLIDSFGLQGFAWPPTSSGDVPQLDPAKYLRSDLAIEAARSLGVNEIWFNTGTFALSYVVSRSIPYILNPGQRQAVLQGVLTQAKNIGSQGFDMSVHMFNEDKSATSEGIDWSYWSGSDPSAGESSAVFRSFVGDLQSNKIGVWIYDSK